MTAGAAPYSGSVASSGSSDSSDSRVCCRYGGLPFRGAEGMPIANHAVRPGEVWRACQRYDINVETPVRWSGGCLVLSGLTGQKCATGEQGYKLIDAKSLMQVEGVCSLLPAHPTILMNILAHRMNAQAARHPVAGVGRRRPQAQGMLEAEEPTTASI